LVAVRHRRVGRAARIVMRTLRVISDYWRPTT
jgi:hypothetical protein